MFWLFNHCQLGPSCQFWMGDNVCELDIDPEKAEMYECPQEIIDDEEEWDNELEDDDPDEYE